MRILRGGKGKGRERREGQGLKKPEVVEGEHCAVDFLEEDSWEEDLGNSDGGKNEIAMEGENCLIGKNKDDINAWDSFKYLKFLSILVY